MLDIRIGDREEFDNETEEFFYTEGQTITIEHSLKSISKWESKWKKPFLETSERMTDEEVIDYIRCMTITKNVKPDIYEHLSRDNIIEIKKYIDDPQTATWFSDDKKQKTNKKEIITSEQIYCWMVLQQIPFECENWPLNRLLTLIRICSIENAPKKKMSKKEILSQNRSLNAARKAKMHTKG